MQAIAITDQEFQQFQELMHRIAGIELTSTKKNLVSGRLSKRLKQFALSSYNEYYRLLVSGKLPEEMQMAVDLLTTNETQFFREPRHFDFLRQQVIAGAKPGCMYRVWSAACATGEEPYSIAMVLADCLGEGPWEVIASDISARALEKARLGHYALERAKHIPPNYLTGHCLKGIGRQQGTFLVDRMLRNRIQFMQINLNAPLPRIGEFNIVFLRNVMIYFGMDTKKLVVNRILPALKSGGHFIVGHSESLNGVVDGLDLVTPSIYRKS